MLCVCSFHALALAMNSRMGQAGRKGLPGSTCQVSHLEVTGSQGGPSSLRSPQTFCLHLAQDITSLGMLRVPQGLQSLP